MNVYEQLLQLFPWGEETVIRIIGFSGIGIGFLAILTLFRAVFLHNSLSIKRAKRMLIENQTFTAMTKSPNMPKLELHPTPASKPKREKQPLLRETISEEAQTLLDKLALPVLRDDGWYCSPELPRKESVDV